MTMAEIIILIILGAIMLGTSKSFLRLGIKGMCAVAILAALASAGRTLFLSIPSVQPASFIIMICGAVLGNSAGFFCGIITAFISSLFAGIGPWTIYQMFFWGIMGLLSYKPMNGKLYLRITYGFIWGFIFGWGMNMWWFLAGMMPLTPETFAASCISSFSFDLAHALTNAGLILAFSGWGMRLLRRLPLTRGAIE